MVLIYDFFWLAYKKLLNLHNLSLYGKNIYVIILLYYKIKEQNMETLLKPFEVFKYFKEICAIPHGSGDMEKISAYCMNFAKEQGLNWMRCKEWQCKEL